MNKQLIGELMSVCVNVSEFTTGFVIGLIKKCLSQMEKLGGILYLSVVYMKREINNTHDPIHPQV